MNITPNKVRDSIGRYMLADGMEHVIDLEKTILCIRTSSTTLSPNELQNTRNLSNNGSIDFGMFL